MDVQLHVHSVELLARPPADAHSQRLAGGEHAALLAHKIKAQNAQALARAGGHAAQVLQFIVDHVHVGGLHVDGDGVFHVAVKDDPALVQHHAAGAQLADGAHVVADVEHRAALLAGHVAHLAQALLLELHVAHRQYLVHHHDLRVQMGGHREGQLHEHAAGIALHRGVDELAALGEFDDLVQLRVHLGFGHAQDGAVHVDVFPAGHLAVEAGAHLQHAGHPAFDLHLARRGGGDAAEQLEQGGLARAVAADDAQGLALVHCQVHAVQRHEGLTEQAGVGADGQVGVLFAPHPGPPALQVGGEGAAADLAQAVLLFQPGDLDHRLAGVLCLHRHCLVSSRVIPCP